ncbi:hypothetical protein FBULB1_3747 [Fusarium bulbicola]|nr:hypothetical protein FBULB1_3747 [Fusarium bulbicola]
MGSSNLKWVYGSTHRAQGMSNEAVDEYKAIIQQLYLDQNKTREEVLNHLKDVHGFSLSANQFSKATKRWAFCKQPRQVRAKIQPPESIIEDDEQPNPLILLKELFEFESDVLDAIDETEACFQTGSECIKDPQTFEDVQEQLSHSGTALVSEAPLSIKHSVDIPCDALPCNTDKHLLESSKGQLQQLETARKLEIALNSIGSKTFSKIPFGSYINNKSRVDYLTCCYLFQEAVDCLETSGNALGNREHQLSRSNTDRLFTECRRDKDQLLASPTSSLDMWSILCLKEPHKVSIPDDLLDRLDINDLRLMNEVKACLRLCEKWIGLVVKGLPRGALQFDSLLLHQDASKAVQNMYHPLRKQGPVDLWQEAGLSDDSKQRK